MKNRPGWGKGGAGWAGGTSSDGQCALTVAFEAISERKLNVLPLSWETYATTEPLQQVPSCRGPESGVSEYQTQGVATIVPLARVVMPPEPRLKSTTGWGGAAQVVWSSGAVLRVELNVLAAGSTVSVVLLVVVKGPARGLGR